MSRTRRAAFAGDSSPAALSHVRIEASSQEVLGEMTRLKEFFSFSGLKIDLLQSLLPKLAGSALW